MICVIHCKNIINKSPNAPFIVVCPNCGTNNEFYGYPKQRCISCNEEASVFTNYIEILENIVTRFAYYTA